MPTRCPMVNGRLAIPLAHRVRRVAAALALFAASPWAVLAQAPRARGVDSSLLDRSVRPQDDLYQFAVGGWLAATSIPEDRPAWGAYSEVEERTQAQLKELFEEIERYDGPRDSTEGRLRDYLRSYMAEDVLEHLDSEPIRKYAAALRGLGSRGELAPALALYAAVFLAVIWAQHRQPSPASDEPVATPEEIQKIWRTQ